MSKLELKSLHWYKTSENPFRLRHIGLKLLVKHVPPTFPGSESIPINQRPIYYSSGYLIQSIDKKHMFFIVDGIAGNPHIDTSAIIEYIFI